MIEVLFHTFAGPDARPVFSRRFSSRCNDGPFNGILLWKRFVMRAFSLSFPFSSP